MYTYIIFLFTVNCKCKVQITDIPGRPNKPDGVCTGKCAEELEYHFDYVASKLLPFQIISYCASFTCLLMLYILLY